MHLQPLHYKASERLARSLGGALKSPIWRRAKKRMALCRLPGARVCYGVNGDNEFDAYSACACRWHGCVDPRIESRIRRIWAEKPGRNPELDHLPGGLFLGTWQRKGGERGRARAWLEAWEMWANLLRWFGDHEVPVGRWVAVLEAHQDGWPHIHAVTEYWPGDRYPTRVEWRTGKDGKKRQAEVITHIGYKSGRFVRLKDRWCKLGGGPHTCWEKLSSDGSYIAKYASKDAAVPEDVQALMTVNDRRRWTCSPGLKPEKSTAWRVFNGRNNIDLEGRMRKAAREQIEAEKRTT